MVAADFQFPQRFILRSIMVAILAVWAGQGFANCGECGDYEGEPEPPAPASAPQPDGNSEGSVKCDPYSVTQILDLTDAQIAQLLANSPYSIIIIGFDRGPSHFLIGHLLINREEATQILLAASEAPSLEARNAALDVFAEQINAEIAELTAQLATSNDPQTFQSLMQAYTRLLTINSIRNSPILTLTTNWCR